MRIHTKRYNKLAEILKDKTLPMALPEAVKILKEFGTTKFDQSVECVIHLGIDTKAAEQLVRGSISLPHGIGKSFKVIAFCEGEQIEAAKAAGAMEAGSDELVKKVQDGWTDFDIAISSPGMMRMVGRLGRVLGPQGKMPSPKAGTVTEDIVAAVKEYSAGKQEYRNDNGGNIQLVVGKLSFDADKLQGNIETFINHIRKNKPATAKGVYMLKCSISATMSPGIEIKIEQ
jgi:large subunit ribosomal protein L1